MTSPASKGVKSSSSGSGQLAVLSPNHLSKVNLSVNSVYNTSVTGKNFSTTSMLYTVKKSRYACTRCKVTFADNDEFKVHMRQHQSDDMVEVKCSRLNDGQKRRK